MPQQTTVSTENNFSMGLKTEYTVLNFPENASTDTENCIFNRIGNVTRRSGFDYETNFALTVLDRTEVAVNNFVWVNAGGDGNSKIFVLQVGSTLSFYLQTAATIASPLSTTLLPGTTLDMSPYSAVGSLDNTQECQFSSGNGYLFVYRPDLDPFYCIYTPAAGIVPATVTAHKITIQIRDFVGIPESIADNFRPTTLTADHQYNLQNQGWTGTNPWTATINGHSPVWTFGTGLKTMGISSQTNTTSITLGAQVKVYIVWTILNGADGTFSTTMIGNVVNYVSPFTQITVNVTSFTDQVGGRSLGYGSNGGGTPDGNTIAINGISMTLQSAGNIPTWHTAIGNYPSNSDIWWEFKDQTGAFNPAATIGNITLDNAPAPKGSYILSAFNQDRTGASGLSGLTPITTNVRPRTGTFFAGRVWFTGVDSSAPASGDAPYYTWTENIYFSQIIQKTDQFGYCYEVNDPTSEIRFDLLPSDGGVIVIQGSGSIYKLFPIQNGLLVFAANGVWFITGSTGIGFTANDYTVTKLSGIQSIASTSYVNVQGYPVFWNEEGIYSVIPNQGVLQVEPLTFTTIQTFYQNIPLSSRKYARGDFDPLNWTIRWIYKTTEAIDVTDRYAFDGMLTLNTATKAFYPWSIAVQAGAPAISGLAYVVSPGGSTGPDPTIKYVTSVQNGGTYNFTFAEENSPTYRDWVTPGFNLNYTSYFITGYKVHGQGQRKFQDNYLYVYLNNYINMSYKMQGIWDFAISGNSGKFSSLERIDIVKPVANFAVAFNRHRIRGRGLVYQFKITSVDGIPFDILGWSVQEKQNVGV